MNICEVFLYSVILEAVTNLGTFPYLRLGKRRFFGDGFKEKRWKFVSKCDRPLQSCFSRDGCFASELDIFSKLYGLPTCWESQKQRPFVITRCSVLHLS